MSDVVLHHYMLSPYAEKVRRMLGFKGIPWHSVDIPVVMPKPDLTALTGGYRKTPVLQVGADIYCDTDLIARVLERIQPEPTLFPPGTESLSYLLGPWQNELFFLAVYQIGTAMPVFPDGFVEDRAKMIAGGFSLEKIARRVGPQREQLRARLDLLDRLLATRSHLLGDAPSLADFAINHPIFVLRSSKPTSEIVAPFMHVRRWADRMDAIGHGTFSPLASSDAIELARAATPRTDPVVDPAEPNGLEAGDVVEVVHESFGNDPTRGTLVGSSIHEIAVRRTDPRAGDVVVHFPREHYLVTRVQA
jgi:glutathione S-transferase